VGVVGPGGVEEGGEGGGEGGLVRRLRVGGRVVVVRLRIEGRSGWGRTEVGGGWGRGSSVGWEVVDDWGDGSSLGERKKERTSIGAFFFDARLSTRRPPRFQKTHMRDPSIILKALSQLFRNVPQEERVSKTEVRSVRRGSSQAEDDLVDEVDDGFRVRLNDLKAERKDKSVFAFLDSEGRSSVEEDES